MSKIALVAVAMMVAGERKVFQPGEKLPELNAHDEAALLASKSIKDPDQEARAEDIAGLRAELVAREFQDERQRVQAERASAQGPIRLAKVPGAPPASARRSPPLSSCRPRRPAAPPREPMPAPAAQRSSPAR